MTIDWYGRAKWILRDDNARTCHSVSANRDVMPSQISVALVLAHVQDKNLVAILRLSETLASLG